MQADLNFHWKRLLLELRPDILPLIARFTRRQAYCCPFSKVTATPRGYMATRSTSDDSQSCHPELNPQPLVNTCKLSVKYSCISFIASFVRIPGGERQSSGDGGRQRAGSCSGGMATAAALSIAPNFRSKQTQMRGGRGVPLRSLSG